MSNSELDDEFSFHRLEKLRGLAKHLKRRDDFADVTNGERNPLIDIFPLIIARASAIVELLSPHVLIRQQLGPLWLCITAQEEKRGWWASYAIWIERDRNSSSLVLRTVFIEPKEDSGIPCATTLTQRSTLGIPEFAAWNELDLICQSIIRLISREQDCASK